MTAVLLLSGSTRAGSTSTAALRTLAALEPDRTRLYAELVALPAFDPDLDADPLPPPVARLRAALGEAAGVLVCTPEYAGALPGAFKNLLDWTVGGHEMPGLPVGWVNVSSIAAPTGGRGAHDELRTVLGYVQARVVDDACRRHPLSRGDVGADGLVADPATHRVLREVLAAVLSAGRA
ncbi:hypothetical protein Acsp06_39900 [Actinomycetospora sp. NBRC 106375]|uniref:NADPH-dependent FMN reductase n=1 Tax=Actinomycetospora sp. NBRC 106375 TaxID=3032207 RepID=UPI0024A029FE|nr:NADPH-dependent FMN reductase [Actinomycetospora sp. NBRC 106375]GLZ47805.1 hypothetical protein Acsp06_39900 [Actinomycetospora sp. NBRC 106375]